MFDFSIRQTSEILLLNVVLTLQDQQYPGNDWFLKLKTLDSSTSLNAVQKEKKNHFYVRKQGSSRWSEQQH